MKGSEFDYDHKINLNRGGPYKYLLDFIKNKKATINPINKKDNECFQYTVTVALNHEEKKKKCTKNNKN